MLRKPYFTMRVRKSRVLYNPQFDHGFLGHVTSVISGPTICEFLRPILLNFTTKSHLYSETHVVYKFYTLYPLQLFSGGSFCLSVENAMHV